MSKVISFQEHLRPALPEVRGCKDYRDEQELLERIDRVLRVSGVEDAFLRESAEMFEARSAKQAASGRAAKNGERARQAHAEHSRRALRCTVLLRLCAGSFRKASRNLAMSPLYRWFAGLPELGGIRVPGKSTLQRYAQWLPLERMEKALGEEDVCRLVQLRQRHPTWGARKLQNVYERAHGQGPSESSIKRVLERCGLVKKRRKRRASLGGQIGGQPVAASCNDIWTVDFKGWWHDAEGRCEPLTVRDEYSRYVLETRALADAKTETVRACFERLFELHGLPLAIRSDNGSPFSHCASPLGLSRLSAWWVALGINLLRSRPGRPGDNSHHERLHRDLCSEVQGIDYSGRQAALEEWRKEFNQERPHEALGMKRPAEVYTSSTRPWEGTPEQIDYEGLMTRRVQKHGTIRFEDQRYYISTALAGWDVGLKRQGEDTCEVYFAKLLVGHLELATESFLPMNAAGADQRHAA